jgi:hypothetical protein
MRGRALAGVVLAIGLLTAGAAAAAPPQPRDDATQSEMVVGDGPAPCVAGDWHWTVPAGQDRTLGPPNAGRLVGGIPMPAVGPDWRTWDPIQRHVPNRVGRRYGTRRLVTTIMQVAAQFRAAHPDAPCLMIGDLSRTHGGPFTNRFGGLGHRSHQNGLDADIYYPRADGLERPPISAFQIDRVLSQDLVNRFVAAGAECLFVGPNTHLRGPKRTVEILALHDDHVHVRLPHNPAWVKPKCGRSLKVRPYRGRARRTA